LNVALKRIVVLVRDPYQGILWVIIDHGLHTMNIIRAHTKKHIEEVRTLFREYEAFLDVDLYFQNFGEELADLPGKYVPPDGILLLAVAGRKAAGCGALRKLDEGICEMKRLFVRLEFRGLGLGKTLAKCLVDEAIRLGYSTMLLDTLDRLKAAMVIYESLGFMPTKPYYRNPLPGVVYWKLDLTQPMG
jgi:putative acetyltransferase